MKKELDLPGGQSVEELRAIRRLSRELAADGYDVASVALSAGGRVAALVYRGRPSDPFRTMTVAARTFIRAAEAFSVDEEIEVDPAEIEVVERLRAASRRISGVLRPRPPETVGEVLDVDLGRLARGYNDAED